MSEVAAAEVGAEVAPEIEQVAAEQEGKKAASETEQEGTKAASETEHSAKTNTKKEGEKGEKGEEEEEEQAEKEESSSPDNTNSSNNSDNTPNNSSGSGDSNFGLSVNAGNGGKPLTPSEKQAIVDKTARDLVNTICNTMVNSQPLTETLQNVTSKQIAETFNNPQLEAKDKLTDTILGSIQQSLRNVDGNTLLLYSILGDANGHKAYLELMKNVLTNAQLKTSSGKQYFQAFSNNVAKTLRRQPTSLFINQIGGGKTIKGGRRKWRKSLKRGGNKRCKNCGRGFFGRPTQYCPCGGNISQKGGNDTDSENEDETTRESIRGDTNEGNKEDEQTTGQWLSDKLTSFGSKRSRMKKAGTYKDFESSKTRSAKLREEHNTNKEILNDKLAKEKAEINANSDMGYFEKRNAISRLSNLHNMEKQKERVRHNIEENKEKAYRYNLENGLSQDAPNKYTREIEKQQALHELQEANIEKQKILNHHADAEKKLKTAMEKGDNDEINQAQKELDAHSDKLAEAEQNVKEKETNARKHTRTGQIYNKAASVGKTAKNFGKSIYHSKTLKKGSEMLSTGASALGKGLSSVASNMAQSTPSQSSSSSSGSSGVADASGSGTGTDDQSNEILSTYTSDLVRALSDRLATTETTIINKIVDAIYYHVHNNAKDILQSISNVITDQNITSGLNGASAKIMLCSCLYNHATILLNSMREAYEKYKKQQKQDKKPVYPSYLKSELFIVAFTEKLELKIKEKLFKKD